jgi:predicted dehydrogenase
LFHRAAVVLMTLFATLAMGADVSQSSQPLARLIIVDPGHFHATLLQKEMYREISPDVEVYAPLGPELIDYMNRIAAFNLRANDPTRWRLDVHTGPDSMTEMLREHKGNVVIFSGKNRGKIDRILTSLSAGLNVFADKPWIISPDELPKLERALQTAKEKDLAAYDIMTERYEITSMLQRELVQDRGVFGELKTGTPQQPAIDARSEHMVMKLVSGVPLQRPVWFFDVNEYGEGLADVGTHVVDLVNWTAFPKQILDYRKDIHITDAQSWPLRLTQQQFQQVTGRAVFPDNLRQWIHNGIFDYPCNNAVDYTIRGVHVRLKIEWKWEAPAGAGDVYEATFHGSKASIDIRQGAKEHYQPEIYVVPAADSVRADVFTALEKKIAALQNKWPGLHVVRGAAEAQIAIPDALRTGHEAHFAQVANQFLKYLRDPKIMPEWETANMLAKYYVTTEGVAKAQERSGSKASFQSETIATE